MGATQTTANSITFILVVGASLYVARWLWRHGDGISGIEGKEEGEELETQVK